MYISYGVWQIVNKGISGILVLTPGVCTSFYSLNIKFLLSLKYFNRFWMPTPTSSKPYLNLVTFFLNCQVVGTLRYTITPTDSIIQVKDVAKMVPQRSHFNNARNCNLHTNACPNGKRIALWARILELFTHQQRTNKVIDIAQVHFSVRQFDPIQILRFFIMEYTSASCGADLLCRIAIVHHLMNGQRFTFKSICETVNLLSMMEEITSEAFDISVVSWTVLKCLNGKRSWKSKKSVRQARKIISQQLNYKTSFHVNGN